MEGSDSAEQFAFHIDHYGNKLVVTTRFGFELFDMESGSPELEYSFNALENAPEAWDGNKATIDVTDCEMNADYILCGVATDTIMYALVSRHSLTRVFVVLTVAFLFFPQTGSREVSPNLYS